MFKNKRLASLFSVISILAVGTGIMLLLSSKKAEASKQEETIIIREVFTQSLTAEPVQKWIEGNGFLEPSKTVVLTSVPGGRITFVKQGLKAGIQVKKNEILLRLDERVAKNNFHKARLELLRISSGFLSMIQQDSDNIDTWKNYLNILASTKSRDIPLPPTQEGRETLLAGTQGLFTAWYNLDAAALFLEQHVIRAPFEGTLMGTGIGPGSLISPGQALAELIDTRYLEIPITIPESQLESIELNSPVIISHESGSEKISGIVKRIEPVLRAGTAVIHITLREFEPSNLWIPGAFVSVFIEAEYIPAAYRIPRRLILDGKLPVFLQGKLHLEPVTILGKQGEDIFLDVTFPEGTELVLTTLQTPLEGMLLKKEDDNAPDA
jgi:multidrug efflux pump subunit AcrA (membrane-fusion protein)